MEQFKQKFIEEAEDLIQDLERTSLELGSDPNNKEHIEVIFRAMHSLKGGSSMFGFDMIDAFTHQLETAYDMVRSGRLQISEQLLDLTFKSIDHIKILLANDDHLDEAVLKNHESLLKEISAIVAGKPAPVSPEIKTGVQENQPVVAGEKKTFYIQFIPKPGIFRNGTNPMLIVDELVGLGTAKVYAFTSEIPELEKLDPLACYTHWVVLLSTGETIETVRDVFIFVDLDCELVIREIGTGELLGNEELINRIDHDFREGSKLEPEYIEKTVADVLAPKTTAGTRTSAADLQNKLREQSISSIRVASDKLDELINLVSELVTRQASLTLVSEKINNKELLNIAEDIEKISRRLRDNTFGIRLIPVDSMVTRFQRLVRELSQELKKEIIFQAEGTDTELDKSIIEGLIDPLMHIIRNSIDHGIETPDVRVKNGKAAKGKIVLRAYYSGANVYIQVTDDGKGIDKDKIYRHARKTGLISEDAELSEKEILDLIFLPGFSTAEHVTKVSGRGVGMDVVKRKIMELRGEVNIQTKLNEGTTMTIKLPLTLSIIEGLLVRIDDAFYVIPLTSVNKCFDFRHEELVNTVNNLIYINDGHIPFAYLRKEFGVKTPPPQQEQLVVVEYEDTRFGLAVDEVVGEYQAVLKSLGKLFRNQDAISGATILGDGTVALVMDTARIISQYTYQA
ncbi:MAG: chemotaxis protein CheA [Bacteroidota bacterium]